jgi:tetratricopeptide (TPR) repeat protein
MAFSPDGKALATAGYDHHVHLWDTTRGQQIGDPIRLSEIVTSVAFSPDGHKLAATVHSMLVPATLSLINASDSLSKREPIHRTLPGTRRNWLCQFTPDGQTVIVRTEQTFQALSAHTGEPRGPLLHERAGIYLLLAAPDNQTALLGRYDGVAQLVDLKSGESVSRAMPHPDLMMSAAFHPDSDNNTIVAGLRDGTAWLWDARSGRSLGPPIVHGSPVDAVGFRPDGQTFVTVGTDGSARVWPVPQPIVGEVALLRRQLESETGLTIDDAQSVATLAPPEWADRRADRDSTQGDHGLHDDGWNDERARDAEIAGDSTSAIWHLGRMIAHRTAAKGFEKDGNAWTLFARRGRALSRAGKLEAAAADYDRAAQLVQQQAIVDWYLHRLVDCEATGQWDTLLWYAARIQAVAPDDPDLCLALAAAHNALGHRAQRDTALERALENGADITFWASWIDRLARSGQWEDAARLLNYERDRKPALALFEGSAGTILLRAGDRAAYRRLCAQAVSEVPTRSETRANNRAWICAVGPDGVDDYTVPLALAEQTLAGARDRKLRHIYLNTLGVLQFRAGRPKNAIESVTEGIKVSGEAGVPQDWALLAMALQALGDASTADRWLRKLEDWTPNDPAWSSWDDLEGQLFRDEAIARVRFDPVFPANPFAE